MIPAQFGVDIITELEQILPSYELWVPSLIIRELEDIKTRSKEQDRIAASIALKIASSPPIKIFQVDRENDEDVDDVLLRISIVLCTNDAELRKKARKKGVTVVYLRQKRYMAVDGYLNL
jgi:uncharacterized protein